VSTHHIVHIFRRVLDTLDVDAGSDFFELGGDSLLATRVLSAIARDFGTELSYDEFVENPTPETLFETVSAAAR
jgi:acyl carrier protein